ncbi:bifunctional polynucleotide phosphatase/kinase-like [Patiria miniata]|uniref:Bifunctional polynucleotide phosphatase/kinase n=1 Tax=Patiria miniata TaxID=46514 RepID=A0A913ZCV3_PATMI|nr:bifunctional polynucleotide phosphatase/kinase-like [Patiria miniata]
MNLLKHAFWVARVFCRRSAIKPSVNSPFSSTCNWHNRTLAMPKRKASSRVADAAVAKKAKAAEEDPELKYDAEWSDYGPRGGPKNLPPVFVLSGPSIKGSKKIAGFDIDMTLIVPASGRTFPTGPSDWKFMNDKVKPKLQSEHEAGYKIVFFTNQRGMEKDHTSPDGWKGKVKKIINELNIPVQVFVATGENDMRKPGTKMWDLMVKDHNKGIKPDMSESYYVGDAAGRAKDWAPGKKKDFSCGDRMFAANVGIKFMTPEEYFYDEKPAPFSWYSIDPAEVIKTSKEKRKDSYHSKDKELIIMVGIPASGKSSFVRKYLLPHGYSHVNRDTLNTPAKCIAATKEAIKSGKSVVVDNTNPSKAARSDYIDLAKNAKYKVRCFVVDTPKEIAHHLNYMRQTQTNGKVRRIPKVAYNVYKKNYEEPQKAEKIDEIVKIPFEPTFEGAKDKELFLQWTGE